MENQEEIDSETGFPPVPILQRPMEAVNNTFFDAKKGKYYYLEPDSREWYLLNERSLRRHLIKAGLSGKCEKGHDMSAVDYSILQIQKKNRIDFAAAVSGYKSGLYEICNAKMLITKSSSWMKAEAGGDWPTLRYVFEELLILPELGDIQLLHFYGWIKTAYKTLVDGGRDPGQAFVLVGPRGCGKSLIQHILTEMWGKRPGKPYSYMSGKTNFNSDLFESMHLMIEDEEPNIDIKSRRKLGANIKNFTVNRDQRCERKGSEGVMLQPLWRLSISTNDEDENLQILPPIDDSIEDKLIVVKTKYPDVPFSIQFTKNKKVFWNQIVSEIPAFLYWINNEFEIPVELQDERFGVKHFFNQEIRTTMERLSPENRLLQLIDLLLFHERNEPWIGRAIQLESELIGVDPAIGFEAKKLLSWNNACATYLGRLEKKYPERVIRKHTKKGNIWTIFPPTSEN